MRAKMKDEEGGKGEKKASPRPWSRPGGRLLGMWNDSAARAYAMPKKLATRFQKDRSSARMPGAAPRSWSRAFTKHTISGSF